MRLRLRQVAGALLVAAGMASAAVARPAGIPSARTWAAYYGGDPAAATDLSRFDVVVLDPGRHPPLPAVTARGARVLMYVSVGEINVHHPAYAAAEGAPWVLEPNPNWPDARGLDVRAEGFERWFRQAVVAPALATGAHGLFLDTVDSAIERERVDPHRFAGMRAALERLLRRLRKDLGTGALVLNGALPLAETASDVVTAVAVESVWSNYDFQQRRYLRRPAADAAQRAEDLRRLQRRGLPVLTLEYAAPDDREWVRRMIELSRSHGFVPYVATIGLDRVHTTTLDANDAVR